MELGLTPQKLTFLASQGMKVEVVFDHKQTNSRKKPTSQARCLIYRAERKYCKTTVASASGHFELEVVTCIFLIKESSFDPFK